MKKNYIVVDNSGGKHILEADSDCEVIEFLKERFVDYIYSVLSTDYIVVYRPNGYILCYINSSNGEQNIKSMLDWGVKNKNQMY